MSKFQYYSIDKLVHFFLEQGKEGGCWDFKQEWHENMQDLMKDIICFANTVHDENCYLIFGISDDLNVVGMKKTRRKQADIIDAISKLNFAGDIYPKIEVKTIMINDYEIDVLIIYNTDKTPIFLKKQYGSMRMGCIYSRVEDKNTPDNGNSDIVVIENLWRKRLGLTKTPLEYIYDKMHNKLEWNEKGGIFYNIYRPEYTIEIVDDSDSGLGPEFYSYAMTNENTFYREINIKYQHTILESYQLVVLDGGRLMIPTPEWGFICHDREGSSCKYGYKYYVNGSERFRLLLFLYDSKNEESKYAWSQLEKVVLIYKNSEERLAFETYLEANQEKVEKQLELIEDYRYINTGNVRTTVLYKERLHVGVALNNLLEEWRKEYNDI